MSWQRVKTICKIEASIFLVIFGVLFFHRDFVKAKIPVILDQLSNYFKESAGDGGEAETIKESVIRAVSHTAPEEPVLPTLEELNLEVLDKNCVTNGMPESEVIAALGKPNGDVLVNGRRLLFFGGGQVDVTGGFVTNLPNDFIAKFQAWREKAAQREFVEARQKAKGLVLFEGKWVTPDEAAGLVAHKNESEHAEKERRIARRKMQEQAEMREREAYELMNRVEVVYDANGSPVDHSELVTIGKITVVDFYADWCGPCRQIAPYLDALAKSDKDIVLKKVDILRWGSLRAKKYNVQSVPNIRVFDRRGRLVAPPTSSLADVQQNIEKAKNR